MTALVACFFIYSPWLLLHSDSVSNDVRYNMDDKGNKCKQYYPAGFKRNKRKGKEKGSCQEVQLVQEWRGFPSCDFQPSLYEASSHVPQNGSQPENQAKEECHGN